MKRQELRAWLALAVGVVCIALAAVWVKLAKADPISIGFYRMVFGVIGVLPFLFFEWKKRQNASKNSLFSIKKAWPALVAGGLWGINLACWNTAVLYGQATLATLLNNLAPIWAGLFALYFFREKLAKNYWPGVAVAMTGVAMAFWSNISAGFRFETATFLALPTSLLYASNILFQRRARQNGLSAFELLFWVSMASGAVLLLVGIGFGSPFSGFSAEQWAIFVAAGLVSSLIGWGLIGWALGHLPASTTSVALLNQAVVTAVLDYFIFGQSLSPMQLLGGLVILIGLAIVVSKGK